MKKLVLEAPWYTFQKKVKVLFEQDPEISVGDVYQPGDGTADYAFDMEVRSREKLVALDRVLPKVRGFGNVTLHICLRDGESDGADGAGAALYEAVFRGNRILKDVRSVTDNAGVRHGFVRFQPEVLQFFDDDLSDYNGNWSGLAQDIAREVFSADFRGVHFCTADLRENESAAEDTRIA